MRRMPRRGILRITLTATMALEQPRNFIALPNRRKLPCRSPFPKRAEVHFAVAADFLACAAVAITSADDAPRQIDYAIRTAFQEKPAPSKSL